MPFILPNEKKKKKREYGEYAPVPSYQQARTWSGEAGYGAKRYLGGPVSRTLEIPQQYVTAMLAGAKGNLPDDWNMGSPWARIIYPSRYPRIRAMAVTGSENPWINLAYEVGSDPVIWFGGSETQLGKASKLIGGLDRAAEVRRATLLPETLDVLDRAGDVRGALKLVATERGANGVRSVIRDIIGEQGTFKKYEPLAKAYEKYHDVNVFEPTYRMSEQLRGKHRNVLGFGTLAGLGRATDIDVLGRLREPAARAWERYEGIKQAIKVGTGFSKYRLNPAAIQRTARIVDRMDPNISQRFEVSDIPHFEETVRGLRESVSSEGKRIAVKLGRASAKDITEPLYRNATTPELTKKVSRAFADIIQGDIRTYPAPAMRSLSESYYNLIDGIVGKGEQKYKDFELLPMYIPREIKTMLYKGLYERVMPKGFLDHITDPLGKLAKRVGLGNDYRRIKGWDEVISVTNTHHFSRAVKKWQSIEERITFGEKMITEATKKGDTALVQEINEAMKPLKQFQNLISVGLEREWSPHQINHFIRTGQYPGTEGQMVEGMGRYIQDFIDSPEGRKFGFKPGMTPDDWEYFEEDFRKIIPERLLEHGKSMSSGGVLSTFLGRFGVLKDDFARMLAANQGDPDRIVDELGVIEDLQKSKLPNNQAFRGRTMVRVVDHLEKQMGLTEGSAKSIIGKILGGKEKIENLHMDIEAANAFGDLLKAHERLPIDVAGTMTWDKWNRSWAHMALFGGRASYIFNNLMGDRWNIYLAGAHPKYWGGTAAAQIMLPEGKVLPWAPFLKGMADDKVAFVSKSGIAWTKQMVLDAINEYDIDGGIFSSQLFEMMDKVFYKGVPKSKEILTRIKQGELSAPMQYMAQLTEKNGRYSLFMHFLEEGYHPADASQMVARYLFDYSKQSPRIRRIAPFYWWTANNVPLQFTNMWQQPGKFQLPSKVQWAMESRGLDPTEDAKPEYMQASGVYYGVHQGKDTYVDLSNIPTYAAQEMMGLLNSDEGWEGIINAAFKRAALMTSPYIQLGFEFGTRRDLYTDQRITSGGTGPIPERGIPEFLGISVQGQPGKQMGAHIIKTIIPPLDLLDMINQRSKNPKKHMPPSLAGLKYIVGAPVTQANRNSWEVINLTKKINVLVEQKKAYEAQKNYRKVRELDFKIKTMRKRTSVLNKLLEEENKRIERKGR